MPKFEVTYKQVDYYVIEVEAENEDAAYEEAVGIAECEEDLSLYYVDSDGDFVVREVVGD